MDPSGGDEGDRELVERAFRQASVSHLRRARASDEGGRGLLLVAQLTTRWGTRHSATGKTIRTEQQLPD